MVSNNFPEGLRVLLFDEDPVYLLELEKSLQEFRYEVLRCNEEERAMYLLRNHRNRFDIAVIEVHNSDGNRFRLISEMDLPFIIMSKDESPESVIKWISNGACCDYLIKPIRPEDLRFIIFKQVAKKIRGRRSVVTGEAEEKASGEKSSSVGDSTIGSPNKRKISICLDAQVNEKDHHDHDHDRARAYTSKKRRVVWDDELHKKFINAVEYLGIDKAVPKKILEIMNVKNISRENVASHLQKFRINQKKRKDQIEREERNRLIMLPQEERMYVREDATDFYTGRNLQFSTHHNNIPQPLVQQHTTNPDNLTTQLISSLGYHHDGVSDAVFDRNLEMTHDHQHTSIAEEGLGFNNCNEDEVEIANFLFQPTSEDQVSLFHFQEPEMVPHDHRLSSSFERMNVMLHLPHIPFSYTHTSFFDQQVSGRFNYSGYSMNNTKQS